MEINIPRQTIKNLSGLIFVFCNAIIVMDRRGRRSLQRETNFLMRTSPLLLGFIYCDKWIRRDRIQERDQRS